VGSNPTLSAIGQPRARQNQVVGLFCNRWRERRLGFLDVVPRLNYQPQ
jgi:hypothetical protein